MMPVFVMIGAAALLGLWLWMQRRFDAVQKEMHSAFKALSFDVMETSNRQFLHLADATLQPLRESMKSLSEHQRELEKRREGAYGALSQQIEGLLHSEKELRTETVRLVQALRSPQTRGSWGELHLRRVVELAGLVNQCDFYEQKTLEGEGRIYRPDLVVRLPENRFIAVDAKSPLGACLDAVDVQDDAARKKKLQEHAAQLRKHMKELASKEYWKQFENSPEYVILFLPAESFFSAALQVDPTLIECGADQNVIVATPTTLIAILRAIAFRWKQESLSKSAKELSRLGQELYERVGVVCEHWSKVGKALGSASDAYNQAVASMDSRVLVTAKKLKESCGITKETPQLEPVLKDLASS
jgi:DNA recombination protein RmuC